jgi:integrase/recombinase XerC
MSKPRRPRTQPPPPATSTALIVPPVAAAPPALPDGAARLLAAFLSGRSPRTLRAYRGDVADFARWCGCETPGAAVQLLRAGGAGRANETALAYRAHMAERGLAAATVARRLAALRSLVRMGRLLGACSFSLEVEAPQVEPLRDSRGPGVAGVKALLDELARRPAGPARSRDTALVRALYDLGLRRAEACDLDVEGLDLAAGCCWILGKGRRQRERLTLPRPTRAALSAWLADRGGAPGPLFVALDRAHRGHRLTGAAVYAVVRGLGEAAGVRARPHGWRHAAITQALGATNGDVRAVQRFSRHKDIRIIQRYDDSRADLAGGVAKRVAEGLEGG